MPPLDFPSSPVDGQTYEGYSYSQKHASWLASSGPEALAQRVAALESGKVGLTEANIISGNKTLSSSNLFSGSNIFGQGTTHTFDTALNYGPGTIGQAFSYSKSIAVTTNAQNVFTKNDNILPYQGTYLVKIESISDWPVGGLVYEETYTGIMQWFTGTTNSDVADGIPLTNMGHATNGQAYYLRTARTFSNTGTHALQIWSTYNLSARTFNFSFRRLG